MPIDSDEQSGIIVTIYIKLRGREKVVKWKHKNESLLSQQCYMYFLKTNVKVYSKKIGYFVAVIGV